MCLLAFLLSSGLIDWLTDWLTDWQTDKLTDWLNDWMIDWLIDWLINRIVRTISCKTKGTFFLSTDLLLEHAKDKDVAFLVVGDPFGWEKCINLFIETW